MSLYQQWRELAQSQTTRKDYEKFWKDYLEKEKKCYEYLLENKDQVVSGKLSEIASIFGMDVVTAAGFLDGINTSLVSPLDLDSIEENTEIRLEIDFEKLYYNMLDAKAHWLYTLPQWDNVLSEETRKRITKEYRRANIAVSNKVGRNDPCPCGSGKKYKKCCGA